ncbi:hypothetical protein, partial [Stutzerimonas stutzeri]|uniref:hypothetical protein n=1 Tax=Stutzerimonas stutzeri TaxID=316 RepID=UPI0024B72D23
IQESQPDGWKKYCKTYGENPERHLSDAAVRQLARSEGGTLWLLCNQVEGRGHRLEVASFTPDNDLNPELLARYQTNRQRVVPVLSYSPHEYD